MGIWPWKKNRVLQDAEKLISDLGPAPSLEERAKALRWKQLRGDYLTPDERQIVNAFQWEDW